MDIPWGSIGNMFNKGTGTGSTSGQFNWLNNQGMQGSSLGNATTGSSTPLVDRYNSMENSQYGFNWNR
jgi:hypothetical protein